MALPVELLYEIFKHLNKCDLKEVGLVCSSWADLSADFLFDRVFLTPRWKDVEIFQAWSRSKRCSEATKELIIPATFLDRTLSFDGHARVLLHWLRRHEYVKSSKCLIDGLHRCNHEAAHLIHLVIQITGKPCFVPSDSENLAATQFLKYAKVRDGYSAYSQAASQQHEILYSGQLLAHLVQGLKRLPNVISVSFLEDIHGKRQIPRFDIGTLKPIKINVPPFERVWHPLYLEPLARLTLAELRSEAPIREHGIDNVPFLPDTSFLYQTIIQGIAISQKEVSRLNVAANRLDLFPIATPILHNLASNTNLASREQFKSEYSFLNSFRLDTTVFGAYRPYSPRTFPPFTFMEISNVAQVIRDSLSLAQNSTHLSLKTDCGLSFTVAGKASAANLFSADQHMPRLRHLELEDLMIEGSEFVQFLSRHDIQCLEMDTVNVEPNSDTPAMFISICEALLRIRKVYMLGIKSWFPTEWTPPVGQTVLRVCLVHSLPWIGEHTWSTLPGPKEFMDRIFQMAIMYYEDPVKPDNCDLFNTSHLSTPFPG